MAERPAGRWTAARFARGCDFYWQCIRIAFEGPWALAGVASTLLGLFVPIYLKRHPEEAAVVNDLLWQIPLGILGGLSAIRLVLSPFWVHEADVERQEESARATTAALSAAQSRLTAVTDRRTKRERLAAFFEEAVALKARCASVSEEDVQVLRDDANAWLQRLDTYLEDALDRSYVLTLNTAAGLPPQWGTGGAKPYASALWSGLNFRCIHLKEFIASLRE